MSNDKHLWKEKIANVRSKGVLGMQLYAIFTEPKGDMNSVLEQMGDHLAYQEKLESEGILFAAGPFSDDQEHYWEGAGMVIIRAPSLADAQSIGNADPMHSSGARRFRVRPWLLNEGSLSLTVTFSNGGRQIT